MFGRVFMHTTKGKKKADVGIYGVSSWYESKRKKVAKLQLQKENKQWGKVCLGSATIL
jgi:hypothetical protein